MTTERDRRRQIQNEIDWLKEKLKTVKREKHRKELEHQIKEREYNLHLADFSHNKNSQS